MQINAISGPSATFLFSLFNSLRTRHPADDSGRDRLGQVVEAGVSALSCKSEYIPFGSLPLRVNLKLETHGTEYRYNSIT